MSTNQDDRFVILKEAQQLLNAPALDKAWGTSVEATLGRIGTLVETTQAQVDESEDPAVRREATNLIGELIMTRQKLERAAEPVLNPPQSLFGRLKDALNLAGKAESAASDVIREAPATQ